MLGPNGKQEIAYVIQAVQYGWYGSLAARSPPANTQLLDLPKPLDLTWGKHSGPWEGSPWLAGVGQMWSVGSLHL